MRYALVSDIHSNLQAWKAVEKDLRNHGADSVLCLGDVVGYGPDPVAVLDAVYQRADATVVGNHDAVVGGTLDREIFNDDAKRLIEWTMDQLGDDAAEYFADLPYKMATDDMLCVHAEAADPSRFDYVIDQLRAYNNFTAVDSRIVFIGHTHVPGIFVQSPSGAIAWHPPTDLQLRKDHRYIVNVGSVGDPRDNNPRASYCVFDASTNQLGFRRVAFDYQAYRDRIAACKLNTTPRCLILLDKGAAELGDSQPLKDMAVKSRPSGNLRVKKKADDTRTQAVDIQKVSKKKKTGKKKFGKPRRRGRPPGESQKTKAIPAAALTASLAPEPPPPSPNKGPWLMVVAALVLVALGGVVVTQILPKERPAGNTTTQTPQPSAAPLVVPAPEPPSPSSKPDPLPASAAVTRSKAATTTPPASAPAQKTLSNPHHWTFVGDALLATNSKMPLQVNGNHNFTGPPNLRYLNLSGSSVSIPLPADIHAPSFSMSFWMRADRKTQTFLGVGPVMLNDHDGKLRLQKAQFGVTANLGVDVGVWNHYTITRNNEARGSAGVGIRLYVNGERLMTLNKGGTGTTPVSPLKFPKLQGSITDLQLTPEFLNSAKIRENTRLAPKTTSKPAAAKQPTAPPQKNAAPAKSKPFVSQIFRFNSGLEPGEKGARVIVDGPARLAVKSGGPRYLHLPKGSSARFYPGSDPVERATVRFWIRTESLADRALLEVADHTKVVLREGGRVCLAIDGKITRHPDLKLKAGQWHILVVTKAIKGGRNMLLLGEVGGNAKLFGVQIGNNKVPFSPIIVPRYFDGDLGPVNALADGMKAAQGSPETIQDAVKALLTTKPSAAIPLRTWPLRHDGRSIASVAREAKGGPPLQGGSGIKPYASGSERALHLAPAGIAADLRTPQLPDSAVGTTIAFRIKSAGKPGLLFKAANDNHSLAATIDAKNLLVVSNGNKQLGSVELPPNTWHTLIITWSNMTASVHLNGKVVKIQPSPNKLPPAQASFRFGSAANGQSAEVLVDNLLQYPYRVPLREIPDVVSRLK
jgi:predicted phosphodiesterase